MSEVDIEVSETEHPAVSDINVALIPLFLVSLALTGGYYIFSLFTAHEREPIPSFVDFLELYDCNWPTDHDSASESTNATDDEFLKITSQEQCSLGWSGVPIACDGLLGMETAQESVENGLPCELVVTAPTPCFPASVAQTAELPIARCRRPHQHVYHRWPKFKLRVPPVPVLSQNREATVHVIAATGGATKPFNVLVGSEPAYYNITL